MEQGVLLVERLKSNRRKIIEALKGLPTVQRFYEAKTFNQGLGILSQERVDLIVYHPDRSRGSDRKSPSFNGREVGRDIPLLLIGSGEDLSQRFSALERGAWDYVGDPASLEELMIRSQVLLRIKAGQDRLKDRIHQLETLSSIDSLTGLYNQMYLRNFLQKEVRRAEREKGQVFCMMLDVDHFKKINDREGHLTGDDVLRRIGTSLREFLRDYDFIARYGGDEFTIVLSHKMDERGVINVAERIRRHIARETFHLRGEKEIQITMSLGISVFPLKEVKSDEDLLASADHALYTAKKRGRNRVVFYESK